MLGEIELERLQICCLLMELSIPKPLVMQGACEFCGMQTRLMWPCFQVLSRKFMPR